MLDPFEVIVPEVVVDLTSPVCEPDLQASHAGRLERLQAGGQLVHRGQQFMELHANGTQRRRVDLRTVRSLVNSRRLQEIDGAMCLTPAAVVLLDARSRH